MISNSLEALGHALLAECRQSVDIEEHALIRISCSTKILSNGLRYCAVQVQCPVGCGWLIETYGNEAELLEEKATLIQKMLGSPTRTLSVSEILRVALPELATCSSPTIANAAS